MEYIFGDRYMVWPLKDSDAGSNKYVAMLSIQGVQMSDGGNQTRYGLLVHQRDDRGNVIDTTEHAFMLRVSKDPNSEGNIFGHLTRGKFSTSPGPRSAHCVKTK